MASAIREEIRRRLDAVVCAPCAGCGTGAARLRPGPPPADERAEPSMGFFLFIGGAVGFVLGAVLSAGLAVAAALVVRRRARDDALAWRRWGVATAVLTVVAVAAAHLYPLPEVSGGSDYDVVMANWFLRALGYGASFGVAAILACLVPARRAPAM